VYLFFHAVNELCATCTDDNLVLRNGICAFVVLHIVHCAKHLGSIANTSLMTLLVHTSYLDEFIHLWSNMDVCMMFPDGILCQDVMMLNFFPELNESEFSSNHEFVFVIDRSGLYDHVIVVFHCKKLYN